METTEAEVHVWMIRTDPFATPSDLPECRRLLSEDEIRSADRLYTAALTERYVVSHALVRSVLARYGEVEARALRFERDDLGRPYLLDDSPVDFNLSHTKGMTVVGVSRRRVGVDVERLRDDVDAPLLAGRVLSDREGATLKPGAPASRTRFFDYWTLKEAYAKARGIGIRMPFRKIDVRLGKRIVVDLDGVDDAAADWAFALYGCEEFRIAVVSSLETTRFPSIRLFETDPLLRSRRKLDVTLLGVTRH